MAKNFKLTAAAIRPGLASNTACIASDRIMVDGAPVGYFYRSAPDASADSDWVFLAGDESESYTNDSSNFGVYALNTIANYDSRVLPFLNAPAGSAFAFDRKADKFVDVPFHSGE